MQFSKEILKGAAEIIVLHVLQEDGEAYGYQLIKAIADKSEQIFEFQEGSLYPLLYRLEERGYIVSKSKAAPSGKLRRYYSITSAGKQRLKQQVTEVGVFMAGMKQMLHITA